ncbi:zinc-dependent peptidase [Leucothrix sargassi]|nr:zinc-dependent peptidase [Leucothrix sargassi]
MPDLSIVLLIAIILAAIAAFAWPAYKLKRAVEEPFPAEWRKILRKNFPVYRLLPTDLQLQLKKMIKQFIHEKSFTGCAGQEITDEVKVTIAASACILLLNRDNDTYPGLHYIFVYPSAFVAKRSTVNAEGLVIEKPKGLLGESWTNGKVILSWEDVLRGNRNFTDGSNVAIHEFAHQLDHESGATNGAPFLGGGERSKHWATVFTDEFRALQQAAYRGDETVIDYYGASEPAEFFAVVTETFFEKPREMRSKHPCLFKQLQGYYKVDPSDWIA